MQITIEVIKKIQVVCDSGSSLTDALKEVGVSDIGLRNACKRLDVALPKRLTLVTKLRPFIQDYAAGLITQSQLAEQFGTSQASISQALKTANIKSLKATNQKAKCRQVLDYIRQNGGYVPQAVAALGLKTPLQVVREFAKATGFNLKHYQFAHQRYGHWLTLPGPYIRNAVASYQVPAVCLSCGTKYDHVNLVNLRSGKSTSCHKCFKPGERERYSVVSTTDGETFRSIRDWSIQLGLLNQYQKLRIKMINDGEVTINGRRYQLAS